MRRVTMLVAGLAVVAAAGSCTTPPAPSATGPTPAATAATASSTATGTRTTPPATSGATPTATGDPATLTLAFGGDVHFEGRVGALLTDHGLRALRPTLGSADLSVVNLETAITDRGSPAPKRYHFRTSPQALVALHDDAGVDAVSLANNHAVDYGADGLADTLAAQASSPVPVVGIGRDAAQAFAPARFTVKGVRVALLASTQVDDWTVHTFPATDSSPGVAGNLDDTRLLAAVRAARATADVVVVMLHWGTDYTTCPDGAQERTVAALRAAGADVVVGGHAHRVQGRGFSGRTFVGYGLGNLVWLSTRSAVDTWSGVLTVDVDVAAARAHGAADPASRADRPSVVRGGTWTSLVVGADGVPRPPTAGQAGPVRAQLDAAQACSGLAASPS